MCGRYTLAVDPAQIDLRFELAAAAPDLPLRFNVAPQQDLPVVVANSPNRLDIMRWGLVPAWAKSPEIGYKTINARAETVAERPAYRAALRYHRCLVPATGYYEWQRTAHGKQPWYIHLSDEPVFAFAGLYDIWHSPDGSELRSYTILTTAANELMAPIHDRMPVILPREAEAAWLDPKETSSRAVLPLLQPYPAAAMDAYPVSTRVNDARHEGRDLIAPLAVAP